MKRNVKQIISFMLACLILIETSFTPVSALEVQADPAEPAVSGSEQETASSGEASQETGLITVVGELEELRDERSKQFLMSDGTISAAQYDTDVHYQDDSGNWQEIDNRLTAEGAEDGTDASGYVTQEGRIQFKFAKNANANYLVRIQDQSRHLFFSLADARKNAHPVQVEEAAQPLSAEDEDTLPEQMLAENVRSSVVYEDILPGTDFEYITSGSSLKENIIVKERQDRYQYTFEIKVNKLDVAQEEDGSITFRTQNTGELFYTIPAMYMTDANGAVSDAVSCTLSTKNKKSTLTITADTDWINAEERAFPVVIDPTLESSNSSTGSESRIVRNQYVTSGHPSTTHTDYGKGFLGYDSSGDKTYRLFVQFKKLPDIPADSIIVSSKFYYAQSAYDHVGMSSLTVAAHEVTGTWNWGTNLTWNNQPAYSGTVLDYQVLSSSTTGKYVGWDVTKLLKAHYENKDHSSGVSAFVLAATNESGFSGASCAKASVIQENSSGYFSSAQPILTISYRNTRGLEDYYTYQTLDLGKAGTAYIGDYTKELTVAHNDISTTSAAMPFQISHIYNSAFGGQFFTTQNDLHTKNFGSMLVGNGWKLNIQQTIVETTISGKSYLIYSDEDGTEHYFPLDSGSTYKDEDGLKLTVVKSTNPVKYTMTDEKGNQKIFYNGFLSSILDANGNAIHILYNGAEYSASGAWYANTGNANRITKVVQLNKGQTSPITIATISYLGNYLQSITDGFGRTTTAAFGKAYTDGDGNYSGWDITRITEPDGSYANYVYYSVKDHKVDRLARTYDSESKLGYNFTYRVTNQSNKLTSFRELVWSSTSAYATGHWVDITSTEPLQTYYRDRGLDCAADTADDIWTYRAFDNAGRTISQVSMDQSKSTCYGAASTAYSQNSTSTSANKVLSDVAVGRNGVNLLKNGGAESGSTGWSTWKYLSSDTPDGIGFSFDATGRRSGSKGFCIPVSTSAKDDNGNLRGALISYVTLEANTTYTFSGYYKNTTASYFNSKSQAYLAVKDNSNNFVAMGTILTTPTSADIEDGWTRLSVTFTTSDAGTYRLQAYASWIYGNNCFDDFQLEKGEAASNYNLLTNGDVEWTDGWTFSTGAAQASGGIHGSYKIKISGSTSQKRTASTTVPLNLSSNNTFVLSGWGQANSVSGLNKDKSSERAFGLEALLTYQDGTTETHYFSFDGSTNRPQYLSGNIVPKKSGTTITSIKVSCVYGKNANTAYFDNISLRKEPVACYTYDSGGNVVAANATGNDKLTFAYSAGNLIKEQSSGYGTYTYTYDSKHNLTAATNDNVQLALTYDAAGHVKTAAVSNPSSTLSYKKSITTSAAYVTNGTGDHLSSQTSATGATTTYTVNSIGLTGSVTDALNHKTSYTYNTNNGRMTKVSLDDGTAVNYTYNNGMVSTIVRDSLLPGGTTKQSQTYSFTYDKYGNVTAVKVGSKTLASYAYLANNGPLTKITYGNGYTIEYGHDALGRVTSEKRGGTLKYRYIYGGEGALSRKEELNSSGAVTKAVCYEYDSLGRLIRSWEETLSGSYLKRGLITQHVYDTSNRLTSQSWRLTDGSSRTETYTYNSKDGTLSSVKTASGQTVSLTYDYLKRLAKRTDGKLTAVYGYTDVDDARTTTQVNKLRYEGISGDFQLNYTYDSLGNITQVKRDSTVIAQYAYDAQGQLIQERLTQLGILYEYSYDTGGNLRTVKTTKGGTTTTKTYSYTDGSWKDLMTAVDGKSLTYDAIGNPLTYYNGQSWTFTWKDGRQLATAKSGDTNVSYNYDAQGLRTLKTWMEPITTIPIWVTNWFG